MRSVLQVIFLILALLAALAVAGLAYTNRVILPTRVRPWVENQLTQTLGRSVTVKQIHLHPWHGVSLEQVAIQEDARYGKASFLTVDRISGGILFLPIFKERKIVIPALHLVRPQVRLIQDPNGIWNFQSLQPNIPKGNGKKLSFPVLIPRLVIADGQVGLFLQKKDLPLTLHFQELDAHLTLSLPAKVRLIVNTALSSTAPIGIKLDGTYDLRQDLFRAKAQAALSLAALLAVLPKEKMTALSFLEGEANLDIETSGPLLGPFSLEGFLQTKGLRWKVRLSPSVDELEGQGDLRIKTSGQLPFPIQKNPLQHMSGSIEVNPTTIGPVPYIGELRAIAGTFTFDANGIRTERLTAIVPPDTALVANGSLANDEKRTLSLEADMDLALDRLPSLPIGIQATVQTLRPSGRVGLQAVIEGNLKAPLSFRPSGTAILQNVALQLPQGQLLRETQGKIQWKPDLITVTDFKGSYQNLPFTIEGTLVNFKQPEIDARGSWGDLVLETQLTLDGNRAEIHGMSGRVHQASFQLLGQIDGWKKDPIANLYGEAACALEELPIVLPTWIKKDFPLKGKLSSRFILEGPLARCLECAFSVKATSPEILYQEIPFRQVTLEAEYKEKELRVPSVKALFLGGKASLEGALLAREAPPHPWKSRLTLEAVELSALAKELQWQTKELSGQLFLDAALSGKGSDLNALQGRGELDVRGGRILELPFLGRFADMLKITTLRTIVFEAAHGNFTLSNGELKTEDLQVKSPQATLNISGTGGYLNGLDSPVNLQILPTLSSELIPEEGSKLGKMLAQGASYLVGEIRLTGTWKKPKHAFISKPITQILNEQLFNLQDTLKDLF